LTPIKQDGGAVRTTVYPDDLLHFHKEWDADLKGAFEHFDNVEQPLKDLISNEIQGKMKSILEGHEKMDSILNLYFHEGK
jgi:hypothetical protein